MAILADYPCYHWVNWEGGTNASYKPPDPAEYFADVREVLDIVDAHTEPGEFRDALYGRWYRGKLLGRLGRNAFLGRDPEHRRRRAGGGPRADGGALPAAARRGAGGQPPAAGGAGAAAATTTASSPWPSRARHQGERAGARYPRRRDVDDARARVLAA